MNALTVADVSIRQDDQGRYCLNDLHKAAGGEEKHKPHRWLRNDQTKALIDAIVNEGSETKNGLRTKNSEPYLGLSSDARFGVRNPVETTSTGAPATYVVKELVYAYAMWISPAFNLRVIRAYDAIVTGEYLQPAIQVEAYWFARRPHWPPIRVRVLAGEAYRAIAEALQISRGRVARAVKSMINVGLLDPAKVAQVQHGPARKAALRYGESWAKPWQQMELLTLSPA